MDKLEDAYGGDLYSSYSRHQNTSSGSLPKLGASRSLEALSFHSEVTVESTQQSAVNFRAFSTMQLKNK